jgi:hypothetical protein
VGWAGSRCLRESVDEIYNARTTYVIPPPAASNNNFMLVIKFLILRKYIILRHSSATPQFMLICSMLYSQSLRPEGGCLHIIILSRLHILGGCTLLGCHGTRVHPLRNTSSVYSAWNVIRNSGKKLPHHDCWILRHVTFFLWQRQCVQKRHNLLEVLCLLCVRGKDKVGCFENVNLHKNAPNEH